jgi:hypothetical protein
LFRGDRWAVAAAAVALALGGCMRIYPDPELPDIVVEWLAEHECEEDTDRVVVSLATIDPPAEVGRVAVPCRDASMRFADVARVRYHVAATLEDQAGVVYGGGQAELDLRDGLSERFFAFFGRVPGSNFRVAWTFDLGASCASLPATMVVVRASMDGGGPPRFFSAFCEAPVLLDALTPEGTYTLTARAFGMNGIVAASPDSAPLAVTRGTITDFGTLTLSPCGATCPPLEPE